MIFFFSMLALAFCYVAFTSLTIGNVAVGVVLAYLILKMLPQIPHSGPARDKALQHNRNSLAFAWGLLCFTWDFIVDLTISNLQIALEVFRPRSTYDPGLVYVSVKDLTDFETTVLSSRITLTPGTLSADLTADREHLVVHVMFRKGEDGDKIAQRLRKPIDLLRRTAQ